LGNEQVNAEFVQEFGGIWLRSTAFKINISAESSELPGKGERTLKIFGEETD
jgi:hypothetical protein